MAMTTVTKTLVDALPADPATSETSLANHASHHNAIHDALQEIYGVTAYEGYFTQSTAEAPVAATAAVNTTGATITPSYDNIGLYTLTFSSAVLTSAAKTKITITSMYADARIVYIRWASTATIVIQCYNHAGDAANGNAFWLTVEIYP